ncbi:MAG: Fic/DOC family protein, partial [Gammaproteobacteria bacterium]
FIERFGSKHRFTARDLHDMHKAWMGSIYDWAGRYRTVDIGKGGFQFAHAGRIPILMTELEQGALHRCTPCGDGDDDQVALALAETHAELMLIHPFRDGNGRLGRMLATLMALQAGLPVLDFRPMYGKGTDTYIAGIHAALMRDYRPMQAVFTEVIAAARRRDRPRA